MTTVEACTHHWVIAVPNGPTSLGSCKKCGEERDFFNCEEDTFRNSPSGLTRVTDEQLARADAGRERALANRKWGSPMPEWSTPGVRTDH